MTLIIVDLEATCCDRQSFPRREMEIIEVGAVAVSAGEPFEPLAEFQSFVRPVRHPQLTPFCRRLTSIQQTDVDAAPDWPTVYRNFESWFWSFPAPKLSSWGAYDRRQLEQDCRFHGLNMALSREHLNLKTRFSESQRLPRKYGMAGALRLAGLPLEGTHHRGIDDARNMSKLMPYITGDRRLA